MPRRMRKLQRLSDEKLKARKRVRKPETVSAKPVKQGVQRKSAGLSGSAAAEGIKDLQQTVGNRVVARLVAQGAAAPAVQREVFPASEEKDLAGGATTKATTPGAPAAAPMPFPSISPGSQSPGDSSKVAISSKTPAITSGSKMGSSLGDEAGTMAGISSAANMSNMPGQSNVVPSTGMAPIQVPGTEEGTQQPPTPAPQPEEQEAS